MSAYVFTPYILPMVFSVALGTVLGIYGWRHRSLPGALPFAFLALFYWMWAVGAALELAAVDSSLKIFWFKFQSVWQLPAATALLCFALEYANLGRWLTRRTLVLLAIPPIILILLVLTNDVYHLMWLSASIMEAVRPVRTGWAMLFVGYGFALTLACTVVFIWLFVRSPLHRWPVALCLCGQIVTRWGILADATETNPFVPMQATILTANLSLCIYAVVVFWFGFFKLTSIARTTVIEQMREGMLVLDGRRRIVDLNLAAMEILGAPAAAVRGRYAVDVMVPHCDLGALLDGTGTAPPEICVRTNDTARYYELRFSPLKGGRGFSLGSLILFHNITERKQAQADLLNQQSAVAALQERYRVARELHDSIGQVLGYVKLQAQAARELLGQDRPSAASDCLAQLVTAVQEAHVDVREYILGAPGVTSTDSFSSLLAEYLRQFTENYNIITELHTVPQPADGFLEPMAEAQLLRVIQEALTNVRKHARAHRVSIGFSRLDNCIQAIVQDNGAGFDPGLLKTAMDQKFGLRFMRERAEEVGGSVRIHSAPGEGTQVIIQLPLRMRQS